MLTAFVCSRFPFSGTTALGKLPTRKFGWSQRCETHHHFALDHARSVALDVAGTDAVIDLALASEAQIAARGTSGRF